jgi:cell division protein FtsQ
MTTIAMDRDLSAGEGRARSVAWVMLAALLLPAAFLVLPYADGAQTFRELQVDGPLLHVGADEVREALDKTLQTGFWDVDLTAARAAVERLPWVARARVERAWPATLKVRVWERTAFARWNARELLDTEARAFQPAASERDAALPQLGGIAGQEREVLESFQRMQQRLRGSAFELVGLRQDPRGEWFARSVAGIELHLGQGAPDARLDLITGPVMQALQHRLAEVDYVDLRYTNGFAVNWRVRETGDNHG